MIFEHHHYFQVWPMVTDYRGHPPSNPLSCPRN